MLQQVEDDVAVDFGQRREELDESAGSAVDGHVLDAVERGSVVEQAERLQELTVQLVGEERLGQLAQVKLQQAAHCIDVDVAQQRIRF